MNIGGSTKRSEAPGSWQAIVQRYACGGDGRLFQWDQDEEIRVRSCNVTNDVLHAPYMKLTQWMCDTWVSKINEPDISLDESERAELARHVADFEQAYESQPVDVSVKVHNLKAQRPSERLFGELRETVRKNLLFQQEWMETAIEKVCDNLDRALPELGHVMILAGPEGTGKTTFILPLVLTLLLSVPKILIQEAPKDGAITMIVDTDWDPNATSKPRNLAFVTNPSLEDWDKYPTHPSVMILDSGTETSSLEADSRFSSLCNLLVVVTSLSPKHYLETMIHKPASVMLYCTQVPRAEVVVTALNERLSTETVAGQCRASVKGEAYTLWLYSTLTHDYRRTGHLKHRSPDWYWGAMHYVAYDIGRLIDDFCEPAQAYKVQGGYNAPELANIGHVRFINHQGKGGLLDLTSDHTILDNHKHQQHHSELLQTMVCALAFRRGMEIGNAVVKALGVETTIVTETAERILRIGKRN